MFEHSPHSTHAAMYLNASVSSFWKWSENGQEIAWADGRTIAFLPELVGVLERLASEGLPPLGSIVLLLAACRKNWREPPSRRGLLAGVLDAGQAESSRDLLWEVCNGLDKVFALPDDLRTSIAAKADLASFVFTDAPHRLRAEFSRTILDTVYGNGHLALDRPAAVDTSAYWLVRDLAAAREGLNRLDAEALRSRIRTGVDSLPTPAPIESPPLKGRAWLAWLEQQQEFEGLAQLARRILAVLHIPRHLHEAEELPIGGVTDIAPRGPLDRLLLSELAHDDLTLAVRIAMNEALYLRRESPPKTPPRQRRILLDAGLRSWGVPRLFGTAVALALTAHAESDLEVFAHRAAGNELAPVTLESEEGLREHLAALDHRLHPGESLASFVELLENDGDDGVLVTSDATLADPAFLRTLEQNLRGTIYLASVARDGKFELSQYSRAGRKSLRTAQFSVDEILQKQSHSAKLIDETKGELPAIFSKETFPLLLSTQVNLDNSWHVGDLGLLTLTRNGRLLCWTSEDRGARQLATGLPAGKIHGVNRHSMQHDQVCVVLGRMARESLQAIWLDRGGSVQQRVTLQMPNWQVASVAVDREFAFLTTGEGIEAVNLQTGVLVPRKLPSSAVQGQTFQGVYSIDRPRTESDSGRKWRYWWSRIVVQGDAVKLVPAYSPTGDQGKPYVGQLFDAEGVEGPVGITLNGSIYFTHNNEVKRVGYDLSEKANVQEKASVQFRVSRDGTMFQVDTSTNFVRVETITGHVQRRAAIYGQNIIEPRLSLARPRTTRHKFYGIGVDPAGELSLISSKMSAWTLGLRALVFPKNAISRANLKWFPFDPWEHADAGGLDLRRAKFPDGSIAVLDSRGLLHLKSADRTIPECTIVLVEGQTAGWCSDGRVWGPVYFTDNTPGTSPGEIALQVIQPFLERIR